MVTTTSFDRDRIDGDDLAAPRAVNTRRARVTEAGEMRIVTVAMVVWLTALTFVLTRWTADFWLPLDAAHFSAEAEWLRGNRDVLPNIHPPLFPGLVMVADEFVGRWDAVLLAMSFAFALYVVAVYALLRSWHRRSIAVFGSAVAATSPVLAEIMGWGGGANLLGFAALIGACAVAERWMESGRGALLAGALCGVAGATHPVAGVLALVLVLCVVAAKSIAERSVPSRVGRAALLFGIGGLPFAVGAAYYYLSVDSPSQTTFGFPDLDVTLELLDWAGREHVVLVTLQFGALLWPFLARGQRSRPTGLVFVTTILVLTTTLKGDPSYQSRVLYLLPVLIGILAADLGSLATRHVATAQRSRSPRTASTVAIVIVAALLQVSFVTRLQDANDYYRRVTVEDMRLLERLDDGAGGILASTHWSHSNSEPTGWFVNAATRRRAISPMGPWLSTDPDETREGAAMQRLFAGQVGIENDELQVAASASASGLYALRMSVEEKGWFTPAIVLDSARSRFPFAVVAADAEVVGDWIVLTLFGPDPLDDRIELRVTIESSGVVIRGVPGPEVEGSWHVVFSLAPGTPGMASQRDANTATFELEVNGVKNPGLLSVDAAVPVRVTTYPAGFPIDLDLVDPQELELTWRFDDRSVGSSPLITFDEAEILATYGIETVVVWNNTGLIQRFAESCFRQTATGPTITIFEVTDQPESECERSDVASSGQVAAGSSNADGGRGAE